MREMAKEGQADAFWGRGGPEKYSEKRKKERAHSTENMEGHEEAIKTGRKEEAPPREKKLVGGGTQPDIALLTPREKEKVQEFGGEKRKALIFVEDK